MKTKINTVTMLIEVVKIPWGDEWSAKATRMGFGNSRLAAIADLRRKARSEIRDAKKVAKP